MWTWFYRLASPPFVFRVAAALTPWFVVLAALTIGYGVIDGLAFAPPDYQQGDAFRIIYVHVPSAWLSLFAYTTMAVAGAIALIWRIKIGHAVAAATAPIGASFTLIWRRTKCESGLKYPGRKIDFGCNRGRIECFRGSAWTAPRSIAIGR